MSIFGRTVTRRSAIFRAPSTRNYDQRSVGSKLSDKNSLLSSSTGIGVGERGRSGGNGGRARSLSKISLKTSVSIHRPGNIEARPLGPHW
jgi:hypothetical protein